MNGLLDGIGRMNMQNGDIYEGYISKGELNGKVSATVVQRFN
mgnify:FL=1